MTIADPTFCVNLSIADFCPGNTEGWTITSVIGRWIGDGRPEVLKVPLVTERCGSIIERIPNPTVTADGQCDIVQTCLLYANAGTDAVGGKYAYSLILTAADGRRTIETLEFVIDSEGLYSMIDGCIPYAQVANSEAAPAITPGTIVQAQIVDVVDTAGNINFQVFAPL